MSLVNRIRIDRRPPVLLRALWQQLLDLPVVHPDAHRELQVLLGDRVPVLVHHHHRQQVARRGEEEAVEVVRDALADARAEGVEEDLAGDEEEDAEGDVAQRPAVLEGAGDEDDLHQDIDCKLDGIEQVEHDEDADSVSGA